MESDFLCDLIYEDLSYFLTIIMPHSICTVLSFGLDAKHFCARFLPFRSFFHVLEKDHGSVPVALAYHSVGAFRMQSAVSDGLRTDVIGCEKLP